MVVCPECGLRQEPTKTLRHVSVLWPYVISSTPTVVLLCASMGLLLLGSLDHGMLLARVGVAIGAFAPAAGAVLALVRRTRWRPVLFVLLNGWVANLLLFVAWGIALILLIGSP